MVTAGHSDVHSISFGLHWPPKAWWFSITGWLSSEFIWHKGKHYIGHSYAHWHDGKTLTNPRHCSAVRGTTTTSSLFPRSMWIAGARKPTPTSTPSPTVACWKWPLQLSSSVRNELPFPSENWVPLGTSSSWGARNVQVKEGELSGLPGVFLVYDFSPFLMKQTEQARNLLSTLSMRKSDHSIPFIHSPTLSCFSRCFFEAY